MDATRGTSITEQTQSKGRETDSHKEQQRANDSMSGPHAIWRRICRLCNQALNASAWFDTHNGTVTALATIVLAVFTWRLWVTSNQQWGIMQSQLDLSERPWLSVEISIAGPLTWSAYGDADLALRFRLKNWGHSPAAGIWIEAEMFPLNATASDAIARQAGACKRARERPVDPRSGGYSLFPGAPLEETRIVRMEAREILTEIDWSHKSENPRGRPIVPILVGCVDYRFVFSMGHHQTPFLLDVYWEHENNTSNAVPAWEEIPQSELSLIQGTRLGTEPD